MMERLRKTGAKVVTFVLFGLLILSFAIWGVGDMIRGRATSSAVIEVGDTRVEREEFDRSLRSAMNRMQRVIGQPMDMEQARRFGLVDQVLSDLTGRALLEELAKDLGLVVSEEQLHAAVLAEPSFQGPTGSFDRILYEQVLRANGLTEGMLLAQLQRDIQQDQIAGAVIDAVVAPRSLGESLYRFRSEHRTAEYFLVPKDRVEVPADPDEAALKAYYEENKEGFRAPEYRNLSYIHLAVGNLAQQVIISDERLREEFEVRRDEFTTPERRDIEQFVLPDQAAAEEASKKIAGGTSFGEVAKDVTGSDPIALGSLTDAELRANLPEITDAVFALEVDVPSAPLQSALGWHLVRVRKVEAHKEMTFEEVKDELKAELAEGEALDSVVSLGNQLDDLLGGGASLEEAAADMGLEVEKVPAISRAARDRDGNAVEGLPEPAAFLREAYDLEEGTESLVTEASNGDYFVVRVDGIEPSIVEPFEQVRDEVLDAWRNEETEKRIQDLANGLATRGEEAGGLQMIAEAENLELLKTESMKRDGSGSPAVISPDMTERVFETKQGGAFAAAADDGAIVIRVVDVQPADPTTDETGVEALREEIAQGIRQDFITQFSSALRDRYEVTVNRQLVDQLTGNF